ncbi:MAG: hypothetical protein HOW97_24385 [Catenulispora sp.]|nr:hypothetical protein [Catenulispora sp.]
MNTTAWLDQRAAIIRDGRDGAPTSHGAKRTADILADRFPNLSRETLGAVLMTYGALMNDAWRQFEESGEEPEVILPLLCCLTDTAGEHLYAPEGGTT